jgi:hypothetical protein
MWPVPSTELREAVSDASGTFMGQSSFRDYERKRNDQIDWVIGVEHIFVDADAQCHLSIAGCSRSNTKRDRGGLFINAAIFGTMKPPRSVISGEG